MSLRAIAAKSGRSLNAISRLIRQFSPSSILAERFLRANALALAERIVAKADVPQAIEVLSRPNIGVLASSRASGGVSVMMSISNDSLGGVVVHSSKEASNAARTRSSLPHEGPYSASIPREQGGRSEEYEEWQPVIQQGQEAGEEDSGSASDQLPAVRPAGRRRPHERAAAGQDSPVVKRKKKSKAKAKTTFIDLHPSRIAIRRDHTPPPHHGGPRSRAVDHMAQGDSNIHLRYDIVEPEPEPDDET